MTIPCPLDTLNGVALEYAVCRAANIRFDARRYRHADDWGKAGPLLHEKRIGLTYGESMATAHTPDGQTFCDQNPLVAGLRGYIWVQLGEDTLSIPTEYIR